VQLGPDPISVQLRGGTGRIATNDSVTVVGRRTIQGIVRAYYVRNHNDGSWIIAKGVLARCLSTALLLCVAVSRVLR